ERQSRARRLDRGWPAIQRVREGTVFFARQSAHRSFGSGGAGPLEGRAGADDVRRLMPKIRWTDLPPSLRQHLFDRVADRQIPADDLYKLKLWRESEPEAPAGPWYKDFGSFKICGEGEFPKTFLLKGQPAKGKAL